jgi:hypothetical protein
MSGALGDPGHDLEAMICRYNLGKIDVNATATTASISASTSAANYAKQPNSYTPCTTNYAPRITNYAPAGACGNNRNPGCGSCGDSAPS